MECPISAALLSQSLGGEGTPLKLDITLTTSDEVMELRARVADLEAQLAELKEAHRRTEYLYRCECLLNFEMQDLLKSHRIAFPARLAANLAE